MVLPSLSGREDAESRWVGLMEKYEQRGVSAGKEEVHAAVKDLYHGLYP